tara:strand:+ start:239 stop:763 length:525 start_codon:yes stop_codon:yes gene_type:complete
MIKNKAVFLDRDGVLNKAIRISDLVSRPPWHSEEIEIFEEAFYLIRLIKSFSYIPIVVTNQPDIGRGDIDQKSVFEINKFIIRKLGIEYSFICPHGNDFECNCRKPKPGMLLKASKKYNINLSSSFMIGDRAKDIYAGVNAGTKTIFLSEITIGVEDYLCKNHKHLIELLKIIL